MDATDTWALLLASTKTMVNRITYATWFEPLSLQSDDGQTLRVSAPDELFAAWFEGRYGDVVQQALNQIGRSESRVIYIPKTP